MFYALAFAKYIFVLYTQCTAYHLWNLWKYICIYPAMDMSIWIKYVYEYVCKISPAIH